MRQTEDLSALSNQPGGKVNILGSFSTGVNTTPGKVPNPQENRDGARGENRTPDQGLMSPLLYR